MLPTTPTIFTQITSVNLLDYAAIAVPAGFRANGLPAGGVCCAIEFV